MRGVSAARRGAAGLAVIGFVAALVWPAAAALCAPADVPPPSASAPVDSVPAPPATEPATVPAPPAPEAITVPPPPPAAAPKPARKPGPFAEIDLSRLETRDLRLLYFDPSETYLTPYIARSFLNSLALQKRVFAWKPWEKTTILLKDFSDYGNAAARASPNNAILVDIAPLSQTFETFSAGERFFTLMNHEPVHVATMDVWDENDAQWRRFFHGKPMPIQEHPETILYNFLATPRVNVPRWYLEGSAVFMETWMAGGFGRAQGAYDEMVFRSMVRDKARFFSPLGLESEGTAVDFQVGVNDYLYGTRFFSYLALTRSPEKVIEWLRRDDGSAAYYSVQFRRVFGQGLDDAWKDWIAWEHEFQAKNLASVAKEPLTPLERLTPRALGSVSRAFIEPTTGAMIGGFRYPGVIGHIGVLSLGSGKIRRLTDIQGAMLYRVTSLAYDPGSHQAFYTTDNYAFRNIMSVDVRTGAVRTLISHGRIGDLAFDPKDRSLWGLRHLNGYVTLVKIPYPYKDWTQVHTFPYGRILFDLDVSPDGSRLSASVGEINGDQSVQVFNLDDMGQDDPQPVASLKLGTATPESFVFSPDGRYVYGSAYFTGVSNIYRMEIATQKVEAVSNAQTGLFRPMPQPDGRLIAFEYTGQGFTPVRFDPKPLEDLGAITFLGTEIVKQHPIVKTWEVGSPAAVPLDSLITSRGKYHPFRSMNLGGLYPVLEGYRGSVGFGAHMILEDPMQFDQFTATLSFTPSTALPVAERFHASLDFHTTAWNIHYWHNEASFYDLTGPTFLGQRGDALTIGYQKSLIYDPPKQFDLAVRLAGFTGLSTIPGSQNIASGVDSNILAARISLNYADTAKSLGAVDAERGFLWNLAFEPSYSTGGFYPRVRGGFGFGFPTPWAHSSIWLYNAAGVVGGNSSNPLGSFYLGAFGNNYVDHLEVKRYRDYDRFPGFQIDGINARVFAKSTLEWNLPPLRFADVGKPSLYLSYVRPAIFTGVMAFSPPAGGEQTLGSVGAQIDLAFTLALRLPMTLSFGYAYGYQISGGPSADALPFAHGEAMISLKVL